MAKHELLNVEALYSGNGYVETATGVFEFRNPVFRVDDIWHALRQLCRFNGHTSKFYSVAQHSEHVARIMQYLGEGDPLEGLLHDGTEAYLSDVPAPFKQFFPDLQKYDKEMDRLLRLQYGLPEEKTEACKRADWLALFMEAALFMPSRGENYPDPHNLRAEALRLLYIGVQPISCRTLDQCLSRYDPQGRCRAAGAARRA